MGRLFSYCYGAGGAGSDDDDDDDEARSRGGDDGEARPLQRRRIEVITEDNDEAPDVPDVRVRPFDAIRPMALVAMQRRDQLDAVEAQLREAHALHAVALRELPAYEWLAQEHGGAPMRSADARFVVVRSLAALEPPIPRSPRPRPWPERRRNLETLPECALVLFATPEGAPLLSEVDPKVLSSFIDLFVRLRERPVVLGDPDAAEAATRRVGALLDNGIALCASESPFAPLYRNHHRFGSLQSWVRSDNKFVVRSSLASYIAKFHVSTWTLDGGARYGPGGRKNTAEGDTWAGSTFVSA